MKLDRIPETLNIDIDLKYSTVFFLSMFLNHLMPRLFTLSVQLVAYFHDQHSALENYYHKPRQRFSITVDLLLCSV